MMSDGSRGPRRRAGVTAPLFSLRTAKSWGIGEITDLPELGRWVREAGIRLIQLLPLAEVAAGETSPYSAMSAFGIDPVYISLTDVADAREDLEGAMGGVDKLRFLAQAKASRAVDYPVVRELKERALRAAFARFCRGDLARSSSRARAFHAFREDSRSWLADLSLFRALKAAHGPAAWSAWPDPIRLRDPDALAQAAVRHREEILFHDYLQWIAHTQWDESRARLASLGVELMGDVAFMVSRDSADVWANQPLFREGYSVGAPADVFDADGQDWTLPPYHWDRMRADDFAWLRRRARYTGSLFDRFRIDHVVGFYRTYIRPEGGSRDASGRLLPGVFDPASPGEQLAHGERVIGAMAEAAREVGATVIAEDLGVIPDFVRASLERLSVPGYKVIIWEKDHHAFRDPAAYPPLSVACFGTHDTAPAAAWWEGLDERERAAFRAIPLLGARSADLGPSFTPVVHRALADALNASGSDLVLFMIQDLLGARDRINTPATVGPHNWSYRLPRSIEDLSSDRRQSEVLSMIRHSVEIHGRA